MSPLPNREGAQRPHGRAEAWTRAQSHSTSETIPEAPPGPGRGVLNKADRAGGRGREAPTAASATATSSPLAPASASITRSSARPRQ